MELFLGLLAAYDLLNDREVPDPLVLALFLSSLEGGHFAYVMLFLPLLLLWFVGLLGLGDVFVLTSLGIFLGEGLWSVLFLASFSALLFLSLFALWKWGLAFSPVMLLLLLIPLLPPEVAPLFASAVLCLGLLSAHEEKLRQEFTREVPSQALHPEDVVSGRPAFLVNPSSSSVKVSIGIPFLPFLFLAFVLRTFAPPLPLLPI